MTNVLIGLAGIILFIGLAIAGTLFLGFRFQDATVNSKASAYVQSVDQVSHALSLYRVAEGRDFGTGDVDGLVTAGYMKSIPVIAEDSGVVLGNNDGSTATMRILPLDQAKRICEAINAQSRGDRTIPEAPSGSAGCYSQPGASGAKYFVFANTG